MFVLKYLFKQLILPPPAWFILLVVAGIFWRRRWARVLFWATLVVVFALHSPYVGMKLRYPLESRYEPMIDPGRAEPYDAIVVLMAGTSSGGGGGAFFAGSESFFLRLREAVGVALHSA